VFLVGVLGWWDAHGVPLTPLPGRTLDDLLGALRGQLAALSTVESAGASANWRTLMPSTYLEWVRVTSRGFRAVMGAEQTNGLVTTWRYQAILQMGSADERASLVREEVAALKESLLDAQGAVETLARRRAEYRGVLLVPDADFLVHAPRTLKFTDWWALTPMVGAAGVHVVVLSAVVDQLEGLKRSGRLTMMRRFRPRPLPVVGSSTRLPGCSSGHLRT